MRTTKRFTPTLLRRFEKLGRGTGIHCDYIPWHRVGRGDPASIGRSHLRMLRNRQIELLSDGELGTLFWISMLPDVIDIREQYPLSLLPAPHELSPYCLVPHAPYPGTLAIASKFGIRHPRTNGDGTSDSWRMSTDFLLTLRHSGQPPSLLAISCKQSSELQTKRVVNRLRLERAYWLARDVEWLLITENECDSSALNTLARTVGWALETSVHNTAIWIAVGMLREMPNCSETTFIKRLGVCLGDEEMAKRTLWQGVWRGIIPLDLRRGWRPHQPLRLLSMEGFLALNPVAMRRSAWY